MTTSTPAVYLDNDHEYRYRVTRAATTTGNTEAAAGVASVSAHFSLEDGGSAIASTSVTLTERSAKPGSYFGNLDKAALNTALASYEGRLVYEVFLVDGDAETSAPVVVTAIRRPS